MSVPRVQSYLIYCAQHGEQLSIDRQRCPECGQAPLESEPTDAEPPKPQRTKPPVQTVQLAQTKTVRVWHAATVKMRDELRTRFKELSRQVEGLERERAEIKQSLGFINRVLEIGQLPTPALPEPRANRTEGSGWAALHDACQKCGTTEIPHAGRGLCRRCYAQARHRGELS